MWVPVDGNVFALYFIIIPCLQMSYTDRTDFVQNNIRTEYW